MQAQLGECVPDYYSEALRHEAPALTTRERKVAEVTALEDALDDVCNVDGPSQVALARIDHDETITSGGV